MLLLLLIFFPQISVLRLKKKKKKMSIVQPGKTAEVAKQQLQLQASLASKAHAANSNQAASDDNSSNNREQQSHSHIPSSTALRICFMRLCDFGSWIFSSTDSRRRKFAVEHPKIGDSYWKGSSSPSPQSPSSPVETSAGGGGIVGGVGFNSGKINSKQPQSFGPSSSTFSLDTSSAAAAATRKKIQQKYETHCTLDAALVALAALDEQTTQQYVTEELQYYVLIQTMLHGDPLAESITVAEASTLFKSKARRPVVSYKGFERLFEGSGVDELGMQRLDALIDVQKAIHVKIAVLEDKEEAFAREQILKEAVHEGGELLSATRRMKEVAELRAQLSRATSRKIEQAQVLSSLGALHLESVKSDVAKAASDSENAKKLATAIEATIAAARNTAETLAEETGVNSRFFEEEKARVFHDCQDGCRDVLALAQERWSMLDLRMERLERLMTSIGRSAVVCSMTHLPLAEHQKLLLVPVEEKRRKNLGKKSRRDDDDGGDGNGDDDVDDDQVADADDDKILDQSLEWLKLSTTERFGLMSTCHVLREHDPTEHLVTSAVALTLSDDCVFRSSTTKQLDGAILAATIAFLGLCVNDTTNASQLFLSASADTLKRVLDGMVRSTVLPGPVLDEFLESLAVDLAGGAALWRATQQRPAAAITTSDNHSSSNFDVPSSASMATTMIGSTRFKNVNTPGLHNRNNPSTQSTLRVGITPMDYSIIGGKSVTAARHQQQSFAGATRVVNVNDDDDASMIADVRGLVHSPSSYLNLNATSQLAKNHNSRQDQMQQSRASNRYADAAVLLDAASSVTLQEFVRILTDVSRAYLGKASAGCSPEFCLTLLCQWKITPLCPLQPLLTTSISYLRSSSSPSLSHDNTTNTTNTNTNSNNSNNSNTDNNKKNSAVKNFQARQQQERQQMTQHNFAHAWTRLVGSSDRSRSPHQPTVGDAASFLLAHFPDVIAASRGWDSSRRAGFSGSELFVVRSVLYVLLVVGMRRSESLCKFGELAEFDFVRHIGNYKRKNNSNIDNKSNRIVADASFSSSSPSETVEVELRAIPPQEMLDFIASRPCPWEYIVAAWPDGSHSGNTANGGGGGGSSSVTISNASNNSSIQEVSYSSVAYDDEGKPILLLDDTFLFKQAIQECGLPSEVLQALPAWETISGVVKRAEKSLALESNQSFGQSSSTEGSRW